MNEKEHTTDKSKFGQHDTILALLPKDSRLELELEVLQVNPIFTEFGEISLMHYLSTEKLPLLQDMVNTLQRECATKWNTLSTEYLLHNMLQNEQQLMQQCTHVDLNNIANIIKKYMFKDIFKKNATKVVKATSICKLFSATSSLVTSRNSTIASLKDLAMREVDDILHVLLQIVYAKTVLCKERSLWDQWKTIVMKAYIPIVKDYVDLFYFPEYCEAHSQLEPRTTDYTHMLTNLRSLVCRKGLLNVKRSAFVDIAEEHPNVLSKAIVIANLDKQSAAIALKLFSEKVENLLEQNGDHHEALYVWYATGILLATNEACLLMTELITFGLSTLIYATMWTLSHFHVPDLILKEYLQSLSVVFYRTFQ